MVNIMSLIDKLVDNTRKETYGINISNLVEETKEAKYLNNIISVNMISTTVSNHDSISLEAKQRADERINIESAKYDDGKIQVVNLKNEEWRNSRTNYFLLVSNLGRVYNKYQGCILHEQLHLNGYLFVNFMGTKYFIHRLVIEAFHPLDDERLYTELIPDHINGIKTCNRADNLRWATYSENAVNNTQIYYNDSELNFLFEKLARIIYNEHMGFEHQSYRELFDEFAKEYPNSEKLNNFDTFKKNMARFKSGLRRVDEFKNYLRPYGLEGIFDSNRSEKLNYKTVKEKNNEEVEQICKILHNKPSTFTVAEVAKELGIYEKYSSDKKFRACFNTKVSDIRKKKYFRDISSKYNIASPTISNESIYEICCMIDKGYSNEEIINKLGITDITERKRYQCRIANIKAGRILTKISKDFNFMKNK